MEALDAATSFRRFIVFSVFIQNIIIYVNCSNRSFEILCPHKCNCSCNSHSLTVNCTDANYKDVPPDLPSGTSELILDGNKLRRLTNKSLSRLVGVCYLSLHNCSITDVEDKGFSHLSESLRVLYMSNNPLKVKKLKFLEHLRKLEELDLSRTGITAYPTALKKLLNLKQVILEHNQIRNFPTSSTIQTVESLILSYNRIKTLPEYNGNAAKYPNLKNLSLEANEIRHLNNFSFILFPMLESLDLSENHLHEVPPHAFTSRSLSLKIINLDNSKFRLDQENWNMFYQTPNIQRINMGFCRIESGNLTRLAFHNLRNLTHLDLSGTHLTSLSHIFVNLSNLSNLRLCYNRISTLRKEDFDGIADSLRELRVSSGRLSTVNYESLPLKVWKNLRVVDFSDNRFLCDCDFIWLRHWLKRANASGVKVGRWSKYTCQTAKGQMSMLQLESPSDVECFQDPLFQDPCVIVVLLLTLLIWISASSASAVHRFRWHLRYWYFLKAVSTKN